MYNFSLMKSAKHYTPPKNRASIIQRLVEPYVQRVYSCAEIQDNEISFKEM